MTPERFILEITARAFDVTPDDILARGKTDAHNEARSVAMYLVREVLDMRFVELASVFERTDSTIVTMCQRLRERLAKDRELLRLVRALENHARDRIFSASAAANGPLTVPKDLEARPS